MTQSFFYLLINSFIFYCSTLSAQTINVAQEPRAQYKRDEYLSTLLVKALEAANYSASLNHIIVHPHQQRTLITLQNNDVDLYWSMTSPERETLAIAIKIPLYLGYIGKRALVTQRALLPQFKNITTLEQLKPLTAVQGHDWPDTKVLSHNGLNVRPLANYEAMFGLTATGRIDYFPRSFIEVGSELTEVSNSELAIVPNIYLHYPAAFYYFVSKDKPELAQAIEQGLTKMQKTGEFLALFNKYFRDDLNALPFNEAKAIEIKLVNPHFTQ